MNLHVPQNLHAIADILVNSRCALHIVSAQKNGPINGIVQDGCVAAYLMTMTWDDGSWTMVNKKTVYDVYKSAEISDERVHDLILRAKEFYPEYIINTHTVDNHGFIGDIKLDFADKIPGGLMISIVFPSNFEYTKHLSSPESPVINKPSVEIKNGIVLPHSAPLCKRSIGGKNNSCVHYLWKRSPDMALCFLSDVQQITDHWLPTHGFTLGIQDCFATNERDVAKTLMETRLKVNNILSKTDIDENRVEVEIMAELNNAMAIGPSLAKNAMFKGDRNGFSVMRNSGAKGSVINLTQISGFVGHQDMQGKRMTKHLTHGTRCLPCFLPGDNSQEARGFVENNYVRGLTPTEYYFHSAAGRKGIINTALKSVTGETPIVISINGKSKYVLIGDWIDELLLKNSKNVKNYTEREMELLDVEKLGSIKIPTTDEKGRISWGLIKNITRHDPGKELYQIKTQSGRDVIVTESKSLLIWDSKLQKFNRTDSSLVKIGDFVPTSQYLCNTKHAHKYIDINTYFSKKEYIYGSDFILAKKMLEDLLTTTDSKRVPNGWWDKHNGDSFCLPYPTIQRFKRVLIRSEIDNINEGCIYPYAAKRTVQLPDKLELNKENGLFIGLFLAEGNADIPSGYVAITNNDENIRDFVKQWFERYGITWNETFKINKIGGRSEGVRGYSCLLAKLLTSMVGHGARNKFVPNEAFIAPDEFIIGLIDGYISGDGSISRNSIEVSSASKRLIVGINMLLSRLGIFGKTATYIMKKNNIDTVDIAPVNSLSIRGQWAKLFANRVTLISEYKSEKLLNIKSSKLHANYIEQKNVILDKITSIEIVNVQDYINQYPQYNGKVYDLTVPSTLNFGLANGLHVVDTAETGYIQKRIARKIEDSKVYIDGSVRDSNERIISFAYGDDGMDAKKLISVKGLKSPFFVDVISLSQQLNSDAIRSKEVKSTDLPRKLNKSEIDILLSLISFSGIKSTVIDNITANARKNLAKIIVRNDVLIYECKIPQFVVSIVEYYNSSKIPYGSMVGHCAATSIGEPTTQMVLNTFQSCGIGGKDASTGVPRFKQLINATKTKDQKKSGCIVYFTHPTLKNNTDLIVKLEAENKTKISDEQRDENTTIILGARKSSYEFLQNLRKDFEETYLDQFLYNYELTYTTEKCMAGPINLITYKKYKEVWWHKFAKKNKNYYNTCDIPNSSWIITLQFNVEKLYNNRIELDDIAHEIEVTSSHTFTCLSSPNIIGRIEVYVDLDVLKPHFMSKLDAKNVQLSTAIDNNDQEFRSFLTEDNIDFYICRDIAMDLLRKTQISGIKGITKTYPKEILKTHEFIMETDGINFYEIMTMDGVDSTRTICDDMHILNNTLCIEASKRFIFNDISRVISFDGTYVNPRHISTLVDSIAVNGTLTAASRDGISRDVGPNAKVMFEKNIDNAVTASAFTERDNMVSLASSVMYGKLAKAGSGMVNVRNKEKISNPVHYIKENSKKYGSYCPGNNIPFVKVTSDDYYY